MSAQHLLELLVDEDGMIDTSSAIEALSKGVQDFVDKGVKLDGQTALRLFAAQLDYVTTTLSQILVGQQSDLVAAHRGLDQLITGQASRIPEYDTAEQISELLGNFEIQNLARTYNAMLEASGAAAAVPPEGDADETVDPEGDDA